MVHVHFSSLHFSTYSIYTRVLDGPDPDKENADYSDYVYKKYIPFFRAVSYAFGCKVCKKCLYD
jgi:hypothetical protein